MLLQGCMKWRRNARWKTSNWLWWRSNLKWLKADPKPNMNWGLIGSVFSVANCCLLTIGWVVAKWNQLEWTIKSLTCRSTLTCKQRSRRKTLKKTQIKRWAWPFSLPPYELRVAGLESKTHRCKNFHLPISRVLIGTMKGHYSKWIKALI